MRWVRLRPTTGIDELLDLDGALGTARLVDGLLCDGPGFLAGRGQVDRLALWEFDLVVAAIYRELFGEQIECSAPCESCGEGIGIAFSLDDLVTEQHHLDADDAEILECIDGPDDGGVITLRPDIRFRLPTVGDVTEATRSRDPGGVLLRRCVLDDAGAYAEAVDRAMALLGPRLATELDDTPCPTCGYVQQVSFDLESFTRRAIERERSLVVREVHLLARTYHWSRAEILEMPRVQRQWHVGLILGEAAARRAHA
ncbi:hypothetical protein [Paraliomyxa miuraensis]|uniref:hypothetical protein n=1 Tax=Paraliomyxa miuraensis TaxID=376150 RepID=UPI0022540209|nr:hypothetical protein [Paraliomyxa miuraensis]MCX4245547.1 hypothetical protein [Paraliomyxa miuraensis]